MAETTSTTRTGTQRVLGEGRSAAIPGPQIPQWDAPPDAAKAAKLRAEREARRKQELAAKPAPFTAVTSGHLIKAFSRNFADNRMVRLRRLARGNRDVAWLLQEHARLTAARRGVKPKPDSEKKD